MAKIAAALVRARTEAPVTQSQGSVIAHQELMESFAKMVRMLLFHFAAFPAGCLMIACGVEIISLFFNWH